MPPLLVKLEGFRDRVGSAVRKVPCQPLGCSLSAMVRMEALFVSLHCFGHGSYGAESARTGVVKAHVRASCPDGLMGYAALAPSGNAAMYKVPSHRVYSHTTTHF